MKMESDVNHLVTKPCPGLKQSRRNLSTHAPLTGITTSPPFDERDEPGVTHRGYAKKWQIAMKEAYLQAAKNILK